MAERFKCMAIVVEQLVAVFGEKRRPRIRTGNQARLVVWRLRALDTGWEVSSHTGLVTEVESVWLCEKGRLYLFTPLGLGLVHSLDMGIAAQAVDAGDWQPEDLAWEQMPRRFAYQLAPQPIV